MARGVARYARINPTVGYCQGMAYIGAVLLMSLEEEPAFWALVALLDDPKYLEGYYATDLRRVQTVMARFYVSCSATHVTARWCPLSSWTQSPLATLHILAVWSLEAVTTCRESAEKAASHTHACIAVTSAQRAQGGAPRRTECPCSSASTVKPAATL